MTDLCRLLCEEFKLDEAHVRNVIQLLFEDKCTIPFVTRYRKEKTGSMDEVKIRSLRDRYQYLSELESTKARYLKVIEEHAKAKASVKARLPELKKQLAAATTKQEVDDIYLPFRAKRRTRAMVAREKGLEGLLDQLLAKWESLNSLEELASSYIKTDGEQGENVPDVAAALQGAADILAERINENAEYRKLVRGISNETGMLAASAAKGPKEGEGKVKSKYASYYDYREPVGRSPSHRIMAVRRGESEKELKVRIEVDESRVEDELFLAVTADIAGEGVPFASPVLAPWIQSCVLDSYKRLMAPSIETEIRLELKTRAESEAIRVFNSNLKNLLLLPPLPSQRVLGVDPGLRTGSKLAVVSPTGELLASSTIYPNYKSGTAPKSIEAEKRLVELLDAHKIDVIAIGNGTGSHEVHKFIAEILQKAGFEKVKCIIVNESGASVYSTAAIARDEFPDLDPTIRSAVSIARRLQDPLAELVKIDPRALGIGQYQHDCEAGKLDSSLSETVESCVNRVGVDVNTASYKLLGYVSGIGPSLAKKIVEHRKTSGPFTDRSQFTKIAGFGDKTFEQAAGFLRILAGDNPLDSSAVHPESYGIVESFARDAKVSLAELIGNDERIKEISLENYVSPTIGIPTLRDIVKELSKPGRDPRGSKRHAFANAVTSIDDLKAGMKLRGTVSNVTNFGCFVDIGVHQDGLVHISEFRQRADGPLTNVVAVGDSISVVVRGVDIERKRISLGIGGAQRSSQRGHSAGARSSNGSDARRSTSNGSRPSRGRPRFERSRGSSAQHRRSDQGRQYASKQKKYSVEDLLNKFNTK